MPPFRVAYKVTEETSLESLHTALSALRFNFLNCDSSWLEL